MLAFVLLFFAIAFFTSDLRIRYIAPIIPVLVVLSVMGAEKLHRAMRKGNRGRGKNMVFALLMVALASALAYNGRYVVAQFREVEPLGYIAGAVSREEYLDSHRPEYAAMHFINNHLPQDAKVMLIFLGLAPLIARDILFAVDKIPPEQITKALTLGASQYGVIYRVVLPQIMPRLIDAARLSLGAAWLFLIASEAIAATDGLGYRIFLMRRYLAMDVIFPYVMWITLLGFLMDWALRKLVAWRYGWSVANR